MANIADITRVRIVRTVQGQRVVDTETGHREDLVRGSVVDLPTSFAVELIFLNAAEAAPDAELRSV